MKLINLWTKIENYSDLPKAEALWVFTDKGRIHLHDVYTKYSSIHEVEKVTHYQLIARPEPPEIENNINKDLFYELLDTIKNNCINNTITITNVDLFCNSWAKEYEREY